ncbi:MAG: GNAT family N-acetyltransferase [Roseibium sp.]
MSRSWQLLLGTPANRRDILAIVARCQKETGDPFGKDHEAAVSRLMVDASAGRIYLIEVRDEPVGFASVSFQHSILQASRLAVFEKIYLLEQFRGRRLAQRVLRAVIGDLEAFGASIVVADLNEADPLTRIFELEGFSSSRLIRYTDDCGSQEMHSEL